LECIAKEDDQHISIVRMIVCRSTTGVHIGLKVVHGSDLATRLSCNVNINGVSYSSCILKWWSPNIEKNKFSDRLIQHTEDGGLNVLCGGTVSLQGRQGFYLYGKQVMGNPNVLTALYEELMIIRLNCPCQVSFLDKIWKI
jgi:hypothetical protein